MTRKRHRGMTRRQFAKLAGAGALAAGGPAFLFPDRARAAGKTLKILQWSHFVPAWDTWFNGTYVKEWGQKNDTEVIVDNINLVDLNARAASEVSAKKGHDLFMFLSPPASYEPQVIDMTHVYQEVEKKHGKKIDLAHKSTFNPKTKKYFAFSDAYTPDPGNWQKDWWAEAGYPKGPDTYDDLLKGAKKIRDATGHPCGVGLAQELDTSMAMRAILWSFGGAEQDEAGNVTINSKQTIDALKYVKDLYQQTETPEVFTWTPPSNNQAMLAGRVSFVMNAISVTRQSEREKLPIDSKIMLSPALKGPVRRIAAEHVMNCYVIWEFAENKDGAQKFLDRLDRSLPGRLPRRPVLQFPVLSLDGSGPPEAHRGRRPGQSAGQVQRARERPRLGDERGIPRLRHGRHLRSLQHVGDSHDVRQGGPGRREAGGRREGGGGGVQANFCPLEID